MSIRASTTGDTGRLQLPGQGEVLELIATGAPLGETLEALVRLVEAQVPGMLGSILLLDQDGVHVRHGAAPSLPPEYVAAIDGQPIGPCAGSCGTAAHRGEPVYVEDIASDPLWAAYRDATLPHGLRACWSTPVFDARRLVLGTFAMYYRQPGLPQPNHLRLIDLATHIAAIAIGHHRAAETLRAGEARYRTLVEHMGEGLLQVDADGVIRYVNPRLCQMLGYAEADLLGRHARSLLLHPGDRDVLAASLLRRAQGVPEEREVQVLAGFGAPVWVRVTVTTLTAEDGQVTGTLAILTDVTARRRSEAALQESEARIRNVFAQASDGIYIITADNRYVDANARGLDMMGYTRDELLRLGVADVLAPHEVARLAVEPVRMMSGEPHLGEWDCVRKDGSTFTSEVSARRLDDQTYLAIVRDLTVRRKSEADLRESEARFRTIIESSPVALAVNDENGVITLLNRKFVATFGYALDEIPTLDAWWLKAYPDPAYRDRVRRAWTVTVERAQRDRTELDPMEFTVTCKDGTVRDISFSMAPLGSSNLVKLYDVTEHRRAEKALHDLSARLLAVQDEERRRLARELHDTTGQKVAALVLNLSALEGLLVAQPARAASVCVDSLALAMQTSQELRGLAYLLHPPLLDAVGLAGATRDYAHGLSQRSGIAVRVEAPADFGRLPQGAEVALFRIVQESLSNVLRHAGSPTATVRLARSARLASVEVRDAGRGIPPTRLAAILAGRGALGVGIAGMQERLRQLGGDLGVESGPAGTTIRATLPVAGWGA